MGGSEKEQLIGSQRRSKERGSTTHGVKPAKRLVENGKAGGNGKNGRRGDLAIRSAWKYQHGDVATLMTRAHLDGDGAQPEDYPLGLSIYSPSIIADNLENTTERFFTLREDTFFGTPFRVERNPLKTALKLKNLPSPERTEAAMTLRNIRLLLGIKHFSDLPTVFKDSNFQRKRRSEKAKRLLAARYGVMGTVEDITSTFDRYGETANNIINSLRKSELSEEGTILEMNNDLASIHDPVALILMTLDDSYTPKVRFEAKRKIELIRLIADVQLRDRRYGFLQQQQQLNEFLTNDVFTQEEKRGETVETYLLCEFNPETWETTAVYVMPNDQVDFQNKTYVDPNTKRRRSVQPHQKLLSVPRRTFTYNGRQRFVYASDPPKELERKTLKVIRKGVENPTQVIDDDVRVMGVFDSYSDAQDFIAHIQHSAAKCGSIATFEQIEDTLMGGKRRDTSGAVKNGGNIEFKVLKFHASFALQGKPPVFAEFQLHVNNTWTDYQFQDGVAHEGFGVNRFFGNDDEIGAGDLLFPYRHFKVDMKLARLRKLNEVSERRKRVGR